MAFFPKKTIQGRTYDLAHLEPLTFDLLIEGRRYSVAVEFSCHCFTTALTPAHTPDFEYAFKGEKRAFDIVRHELSLKLPEMIKTIGTRSVYHSNQDNFFVLKDETVDGGKAPYLVFFKPYRAKDKKVHVRLNIQSAYLKPGMSLEAAPVKFTTLIKFTSEGRKPKYGPRVRIKRT